MRRVSELRLSAGEVYDRLLCHRRRSQAAAHEHEQDMLRVKTPLTYCGDEAIVALSLLSGMNIFSFDDSMFGAYEQGADDGMLGIVSRMQYMHLPADAPNVSIVYGASGEMYQPESGVRQGGRNRSCSHGASHEGDAATSLAKAGRYFQVADDEQHISAVSVLSPPDADLRPSVFDRDV